MKEKKKILLVEDEISLNKALLNKLTTEGFEVGFARNGAQALERVDEFRPDLILLDIIMPGIDGIETLRLLREEKGLADLPVIVLSNNGDADKIAGALAENVTEYLIKTDHSLEEIVERIVSELKK